MHLSLDRLRRLAAHRRLPLAFVDLTAFDHNLDVVLREAGASGLPLRIATKSVRVRALLERAQTRAPRQLRGLMCFCVEEAAHLAHHGFDDLLVAYPPFQGSDLALACRLVGEGTTIHVMADAAEAVDRLGKAARDAGLDHTDTSRSRGLSVVLCTDMALRIGPAHLGVRRSPLHEPSDVVALARRVADTPGLRFSGIMGYEAQVAGLQDDSPFEPWLNPVKTAIRKVSMVELGRRRRAMVEALREAGLDPTIVNGGGSGSLDTTTSATGVNEVTAGSALLKPHLFDYFTNPHMKALRPAAYFVLEVTRRPGPGFVTCLGGGYVASGPAHRDKVPRPAAPEGLSLVPEEMCGEVQTPLAIAPRSPASKLRLGDPVAFRHAKGGELAERFASCLLVDDGEVVDEVPTYRGDGQCFF